MEPLTREKAALLPVQHLAWLGDAVYELRLRHKLAVKSEVAPGQVAQRAASALASAAGQARVLTKLHPLLTETETSLFKRGRNCKGLPRSSAEYCQATGLETLVGWLWLSGQARRLDELFQIILEDDDQ